MVSSAAPGADMAWDMEIRLGKRTDDCDVPYYGVAALPWD